MTDHERTKQLFLSLNIGLVEFRNNGNIYIQCHNGKRNIQGQYHFYTEFKFDSKGNFIIMGAWE